MIRYINKLKDRKKENNPIRVAIVGAGLMGKGLVSQLTLVEGMEPVLVIDHTIEKARESFELAGISRDRIEEVFNKKQIDQAILDNKYLISTNSDLASISDKIDIVVDATGNPISGAEIALKSIERKKHIIMLNVEADMVVGPILYKKAREKGVVYSGTAGDEPGSAKELYDFAKLAGFRVLAIGKGKNNPIDYGATDKTVIEEAKKSNLNPRMLAGFIDGTNTMIEMAVMANATGFIPDIKGGHGPVAKVEDMAKIFSLKTEGGILNQYGIVDYVHGLAPGVFAIVTTDLDQVHKQMKFLKMGDGPNYILFRPFHLTSLETPISIARAVLDYEATIAPTEGHIGEVVSIAKRDIKKGEYFDYIGGETVYGSLVKSSEAREKDYLPIGLINTKARAKVDIKKGDYLNQSMVEIDRDNILYKLRQEQEEIFN